MRKIYLKSHEDLAYYMITKACEGDFVVAALYYDDTVKLIEEIIKTGVINISAIEVEPEYYRDYCKEYYITLNRYGDDDVVELDVEPAYVDGRYLGTDADLFIVDEYANYNIVKDNIENSCVDFSENNVRELHLGADEFIDTFPFDCDNCGDCLKSHSADEETWTVVGHFDDAEKDECDEEDELINIFIDYLGALKDFFDSLDE